MVVFLAVDGWWMRYADAALLLLLLLLGFAVVFAFCF
jgi:hypothetical protein